MFGFTLNRDSGRNDGTRRADGAGIPHPPSRTLLAPTCRAGLSAIASSGGGSSQRRRKRGEGGPKSEIRTSLGVNNVKCPPCNPRTINDFQIQALRRTTFYHPFLKLCGFHSEPQLPTASQGWSRLIKPKNWADHVLAALPPLNSQPSTSPTPHSWRADSSRHSFQRRRATLPRSTRLQNSALRTPHSALLVIQRLSFPSRLCIM